MLFHLYTYKKKKSRNTMWLRVHNNITIGWLHFISLPRDFYLFLIKP